jgi:TolB-like protein/cytochrome c-type biogenesis protein CcmH/NrfG
LVTEPLHAVFVSYASEDAKAAQKICQALRAAGIEVWFDQSELRGGDAWDRQIRKQIHDCALFIPVISAHTQARLEGYFRREWKLAADRTHDMAEERAFLVPVVIDDTSERYASVPEKFHEVQWTRLPAGETPPAFAERLWRLLSPELTHAPAVVSAPAATAPHYAAAPRQPAPATPSRQARSVLLLIAAVTVIALGCIAIDKLWLSKHVAGGTQGSTAQAGKSAQSPIPEKSIAVLPFVNMSSDKEQEYFSDGLTEEMIELLGQVPDLRVPARTSSFYFKGKNETIANIASQLKVAHILEGSVRKAGKRLRITAQLIRADNGYHLWSQAYDREDTDVFAVQDDIAKAVVSALQVKLAAGAQETGSRGTTNTEAYNQYLLGRQFYRRGGIEGYRHAVEAYGKAVVLDPNYAAAFVGLALAEALFADQTGDAAGIERAGHSIDKAIALAPNDANGYAQRSFIRDGWLWDWAGAQADIEKAFTLDPRNGEVQHRYANLLDVLGRLPEAIAALQKATELDPFSTAAYNHLGYYYTKMGDYASADAALGRALEIEPTSVVALNNLSILRLLQGKPQEALEAFRKVEDEGSQLTGIAMAEYALGHAEASQQALEELIAKHAQDSASAIAEVFAWRGERDKAFEWLERAYKQRDGGLSEIKTDPLLKSLRADPRFNALLHKLKLPE